MRASNLFAPTLREVPAEAEIASHQLMLRAGMLRKLASGIYTYLPLAWRTIKKVEDIIRAEMDASGCQELLMPARQESGRWDVYGAELWRVKDRHQRDFCLGPTHEEVITVTFRNDIRSYKQLPQRLYQIQTKFRDERRPRFGLMRGREFIMKDCYSFDRDVTGLEKSYRLMYEAYDRIFARCGLNCRPVLADSGAIGGKGSHEFMAIADTGESAIVYCDSCNYAASVEAASLEPQKVPEEEFAPLQKVATPNHETVEDVAAFLGVSTSKIVKTMYYHTDDGLVMVLLRGDRRVNDVKLAHVLNVNELIPATDEEIRSCGGVPGYLGPVHIDGVRVVADSEVPLMYNYVCGANEEGFHLTGVNYQRGDFAIDLTDDIREVGAGEPCPCCSGHLLGARGIEVGQVFKLYEKYSRALNAVFTDENGEQQYAVMGCYGIGVGRTMAAVIEQHNDEHGIIWPMAIAPYHVVIIPVNDKDEALMTTAEALYDSLQKSGVEVVLDDRRERSGVKFNDADLIGYPLRVTIGSKTLAQGQVEIKKRATGEVIMVPVAEASAWLKEQVFSALA